MNIGTAISAVVGVMVIAVGLSFVLSWPVMVLWNGCLVPAVHGVNEITWLQGWGISCLTSILFKSTVSSSKQAG
jgi:hypothetical protein